MIGLISFNFISASTEAVFNPLVSPASFVSRPIAAIAAFRAVIKFESAIGHVPEYALVHVGKWYSSALSGFTWNISRKEVILKGRFLYTGLVGRQVTNVIFLDISDPA